MNKQVYAKLRQEPIVLPGNSTPLMKFSRHLHQGKRVTASMSNDLSTVQGEPIPMLTELRVANYRSFVDETISFGPLTILIGANASGKTNLLDAITFFRDLAEHGIDDALSMQGGIEFIRNVRLPKTTSVKLGFTLFWPILNKPLYLVRYRPNSGPSPSGFNHSNGPQLPIIRYRNVTLSYDIVLGVGRGTKDARIVSECLRVTFELALIDRAKRSSSRDEQQWHAATIILNVVAGKLSCQLDTTADDIIISPNLDPDFGAERYNTADVLLRQEIISILLPVQALAKIPIYDIDPALGKSALPVTGRAELEEDGDNLPSALRSILKNSEDRDKFLALVSDALPFIKLVDVASFSDMTRFLQVRETYTTRSIIPGYLLSDGTIDVIAFIVGLYFQNSFLTLFEEPDRGLHPAMVRKIGAMLVDESGHRQVIATTHSTDLINSVPVDCVQCITRTEEGASIVFRPSQSDKFRNFLTKMGIGQLNAAGLFTAP